ncbi:MAG: response regulator [Chthoniobacterales bacterium]
MKKLSPPFISETQSLHPVRRNDKLSATAQKVFRAGLNHKLRTPLNAIVGFAELLALQPTSQRGNGDVQQILKSARELLRIIERELGEPSEHSPEQAGAIIPAAHGCDILYVEDDIVNFTLVERILELRPKLTVMHAVRGELGLQFAEAYQPKLVLLDLNLPDMHGAEVLRNLREQPTTAEIPVVILSADATPSQIERLLAAGARNYLTKPFDLDPFLALVDEFASDTRSAAPDLAIAS